MLNEPRFKNNWPQLQSEFTNEIGRRKLIEFSKTPRNITKYLDELEKTKGNPRGFVAAIERIRTELSSVGGSAGANARIIKSLAEHLGFLYEAEGRIQFTEAGEEFLNARTESDLAGSIRNQLLKWMYWNASVRINSHKAIKLLPLWFTIDVCRELPDKMISSDEFALFLATAKRMDQVTQVADRIKEFRATRSLERSRLRAKVGKKLTSVKGFASYVFSAFETTGVFEYERGEGTLRLRGESLKDLPSIRPSYFEYDDVLLYYDYFGSVGFIGPHRLVKTDVINPKGDYVSVAVFQIMDSRRTWQVITNGRGHLVLPAKEVKVRAIDYSVRPERIAWEESILPDRDTLTVIYAGSSRGIAIGYDEIKSKLNEFLQSNGYDSELLERLRLRERYTTVVESKKNVRGGRFEQLMYDLLQSMVPGYFDEVTWEGSIDPFGIPMHVGGYQSDLTIRKDKTLIVVEVTLAGPILAQGKDISCASHLDMIKSGLLPSGFNLQDIFAIFIDSKGLNSYVLQNFANDKQRVVCPMTIKEFLDALDEYRTSRDFSAFVKRLKLWSKRLR